jgi:hypothetical protein
MLPGPVMRKGAKQAWTIIRNLRTCSGVGLEWWRRVGPVIPAILDGGSGGIQADADPLPIPALSALLASLHGPAAPSA